MYALVLDLNEFIVLKRPENMGNSLIPAVFPETDIILIEHIPTGANDHSEEDLTVSAP